MISASPQPRRWRLSTSVAGPARMIKYVSSAIPRIAATIRRARRLGMNRRLLDCRSAELAVENALRVGPCLRSIDILPESISDIERAEPASLPKYPHAVG